MKTNLEMPAAYEWTSSSKLRSADGRTVEIIQSRALTGQRLKHWFIRETTATQIRDHHFPEIRKHSDIVAEALRIAVTV